jgi:hypothetical protein
VYICQGVKAAVGLSIRNPRKQRWRVSFHFIYALLLLRRHINKIMFMTYLKQWVFTVSGALNRCHNSALASEVSLFAHSANTGAELINMQSPPHALFQAVLQLRRFSLPRRRFPQVYRIFSTFRGKGVTGAKEILKEKRFFFFTFAVVAQVV